MLGLIHIYYGDGKGKTTASIGLGIRCAGNGEDVLFFQFLKDNTSKERMILEQLNHIKVLEAPSTIKFQNLMTEEEKKEAFCYYQQAWRKITEAIQQTKYRMLILDEVIAACNYGFLNEDQLISFLKNKPKELEVILTGRKPSAALLALADYASEIKKMKHPFDQGIPARRGIEY